MVREDLTYTSTQPWAQSDWLGGMCAVRCLLFAVHCLLCAVRCLLFAVRCLLFAVCCALFAVRCLLCVVCCALFAVRCLLCAVRCELRRWLAGCVPRREERMAVCVEWDHCRAISYPDRAACRCISATHLPRRFRPDVPATLSLRHSRCTPAPAFPPHSRPDIPATHPPRRSRTGWDMQLQKGKGHCNIDPTGLPHRPSHNTPALPATYRSRRAQSTILRRPKTK
eukprot:350659-Chlamydomonas_euryale.AAC.3